MKSIDFDSYAFMYDDYEKFIGFDSYAFMYVDQKTSNCIAEPNRYQKSQKKGGKERLGTQE